MKSQRWTDDQIVWAIQAGGKPRKLAEEYLFKTLYQKLVPSLRRLGATQEEAEESVSEAIFRLIKQIAEGNSIGHLDRYAYTIARNCYLGLVKQRKQTLGVEHAEKIENKNNVEGMLVLTDALSELEKMGNPCQTILTMKGYGYSDEEILRALENLPDNNIHTLGGLRNRVVECRIELKLRVGGLNDT